MMNMELLISPRMWLEYDHESSEDGSDDKNISPCWPPAAMRPELTRGKVGVSTAAESSERQIEDAPRRDAVWSETNALDTLGILVNRK